MIPLSLKQAKKYKTNRKKNYFQKTVKIPSYRVKIIDTLYFLLLFFDFVALSLSLSICVYCFDWHISYLAYN